MVEFVAFGFALLLGLYLLATGALSFRAARRYKCEARKDETRTHWAEARDLLVTLARDGKLDLRSETFRTFYRVQTFILRRPERYEDISRAIAEDLLAMDALPEPPWASEVPDWPEEMSLVMRYMGAGTGSLLVWHKGWRKLLPVLQKLSWLLSKHIARRGLSRVRGYLPKPMEATLLLERAQERMFRIAGAT